MEIDKTQKVEILMKLLIENRKAAGLVKIFDYIIAYSTVLLYLGGIAWWTAVPSGRVLPMWIIQVGIWGIVVLALLSLGRNQARHVRLNEDYGRIVGALKLDTPNEYGPQAILPAHMVSSLTLYAGRGVYALWIILSGLVAWIILALQ